MTTKNVVVKFWEEGLEGKLELVVEYDNDEEEAEIIHTLTEISKLFFSNFIVVFEDFSEPKENI